MGLQLFMHALRMVLGNMSAALRVSGLLVLLQLAVLLWLDRPDPSGLPSAGSMLGGLIQFLISLWIAVAWHRFILLEEQPGSALPRFDSRANGRYVVAVLIMMVILFLVAIPFVFLSGLLAMPFMMADSPLLGIAVGFIVIWLPVTYVSLRIAPILPSAAVGDRLPLKEAWYATGAGGGALVVLALISAFAAMAVSLPAMLTVGFASIMMGVIANWLVLMVGTSLMTTIHGHYVQGRALAV